MTDLPELTADECDTYAWQMKVPGVGDSGQRKLKAASVLISRVGGLGGIAAIPALAERGMAGSHRFIDTLDGMLGKSEYIAGSTYSLADITALCVVDFMGWLKVTPTDSHPNVQRWYRSVSSRPSAAA